MSGELLVDPRGEKLDIGKDGRSTFARTFAPGNDANHLESAGGRVYISFFRFPFMINPGKAVNI